VLKEGALGIDPLDARVRLEREITKTEKNTTTINKMIGKE